VSLLLPRTRGTVSLSPNQSASPKGAANETPLDSITIERYGPDMGEVGVRNRSGIWKVRVLALVACLVAGLMSAFGVGVPAAEGQMATPSQVPCGPQGTRSLALSGGMRIYEPKPRSGASRKVLVCSPSSGRPVQLGRNLVGAPFAIGAPWAGAVESRSVGQDNAKVSVVGVNVNTSRRVSCLIGGADRPGQLPKVEGLWAVSSGKLVVSATLRLGPVGPEIAVCSTGDTLKVVAQGETIEPASVKVQGSVVSWTQQGQRHAVRL
jgi:hypothetical protein